MKLIGLARVGNVPELRFTAKGDAVLSLSLAYNYGRKDPNTKEQPTQWISASLWGERAERLVEYIEKGQLLYVEVDDVHGEEFQGKNGAGFAIRGRITSLEFTGKAGGEQKTQQRQQPQRQPQRQPAQQPANLADMSDDIPF